MSAPTRWAGVLVGVVLVGAGAQGALREVPRPGPTALARIVVSGSINPAVADFVEEAIARADADEAPALVLELDTPGGLLPSTRAIVKSILAAPVPVIVYVAPSGAGAGSAGVFITLAAHVAAMAPGTNIGAAHPVSGGGQDIEGTLGEKIENFTASFGEAVARQRGRNVEWAEQSVRKSVSIGAEEAAEINVVDFVAKDLATVIAQAEGREVEVQGKTRRLELAAVTEDGAVRVATYEMRLGQRVLNVLGDPNIAYLLMMAGILGLYVEFTHPGLTFPGVAGAICLLLGLTALHVLPVNTSGLALMLLGLGLLVAEAFVPAFGLLGIGGVAAFLIGSLFLFDRDTGAYVERSLILGVGGTLAAVMFLVSVLVLRAHRRPVSLGIEAMLGAEGIARERLAPAGTVLVHGELWTAESDDVVQVGEPVQVTEIRGLKLRVRRVERRDA